jgi:hypothetical protein
LLQDLSATEHSRITHVQPGVTHRVTMKKPEPTLWLLVY